VTAAERRPTKRQLGSFVRRVGAAVPQLHAKMSDTSAQMITCPASGARAVRDLRGAVHAVIGGP
jgi:hypothetical protein